MYSFIPAQSEPQKLIYSYKQFDQKDYDNATKGIDYSENIIERQEKKEKKKKNKKQSKLSNLLIKDWSIVADLFKGIAITTLILFLAYLIFRLIDEKYGNKKIINIKDHEIFDNLEQYIHEVDLNDLFKKAIQQKNYKLALRIYYLIIIKKMSNSNLIEWRKQKTNGEYLSEMYGKPLFENFRESTNLYERVWYGDLEIDENKFYVAKQLFDLLLNKIPSVNNNGNK